MFILGAKSEASYISYFIREALWKYFLTLLSTKENEIPSGSANEDFYSHVPLVKIKIRKEECNLLFIRMLPYYEFKHRIIFS